jgi:dipicolinate synthase subunit B
VKKLDGVKIGFAVTGSFCTFDKAKEAAGLLKKEGAIITPVFSFNASTINTRFGNCKTHIEQFEAICGNPPILSIENAEPVGPQKMFDILIIAPCTSNTAAKIALGITDTPVTMAAKSHVRNDRPVLVAMSTNDALSASAKNIGTLLSTRNYFFVPLSQDEPEKKPRSCVADFKKITDAVIAALEGKQIQPLIFS